MMPTPYWHIWLEVANVFLKAFSWYAMGRITIEAIRVIVMIRNKR